ncbi:MULTISPECIES: hypothetical protein [Planktothricoides]|uniref:Uncharacterized protein n=2 Tax=Planktothricoides raciborskii TaxID=132608 RepID=A0AAU8JBF9_9CYAN|nr:MULTISPECIES: hypothetical protein [Planktothricoides]KOR38528.1 hypothetical protein AM228_00660 [Planktothricoides sp. SR001]MBD2545441.1 hypothetical protein [Planktothricoides raciborskii FACHB-1370]MBD2583669.1 hypothetical protein [Planktothricoides raciborskii FACHB-1261]
MPLLAPLEKIIPVSVLLTVVLSSCTHRPLAECRPLMTMLNQGNDLLTNVALNDGKAISQKANSLKLLRQELEKLAVTDEKLQEFRSQFVQIYQIYGDAFAQTSAAIAIVNKSTLEVTLPQVKQARLKVTQARLSISQASQEAESLSKQINRYCKVPSP